MTKNKNKINKEYDDALYARLLVASLYCPLPKEEGLQKPKIVMRGPSFEDCQPLPNISRITDGMDDLDLSEQLFCREHEERHRVFLMRWNPEISSHKIVDFEYAMENLHQPGFYYDWSIWDHQKVHVGDTFYMLRVGSGNTGVVMRGTITSPAYRDEDWSGQGREVYYVRMEPECMLHPENQDLISVAQLDEAIPEMNWNEGHSGVLLSKRVADKLEKLWNKTQL